MFVVLAVNGIKVVLKNIAVINAINIVMVAMEGQILSAIIVHQVSYYLRFKFLCLILNIKKKNIKIYFFKNIRIF